MKDQLRTLITAAISHLSQEGVLPNYSPDKIQIERTRNKSHGDFASNIPMILAKEARQKPQDLAKLIVDRLPKHSWIEKVEIAGPGFINFTLALSAYQAVISEILNQKEAFGCSNLGQSKRVHLEFVSANPTGPLHVGHGRGAAYGDTLARLLTAIGYKVHREYYINDAGRQMDILATSLWLRYLELCGETLPFPASGYRGDYIRNIAKDLKTKKGNIFHYPTTEVLAELPPDAPVGDKEQYIDALSKRAKCLLGEEHYQQLFELGLNTILTDIREDLLEFGITYDQWFSERSLIKANTVNHTIDRLKALGQLYQKEGAWWFRSTDFGDEKDRVIVRENGQPTYFASDTAYHLDKLDRGYAKIIDVWGADHHGYIPRIKAFFQALNVTSQQFEINLVQFAILYRGKEKVQMSTRSGEFVTLRELRYEIGKDAARFFYVMRSPEQHMDFDLELAKSRSNENPVYYIQYAHARIANVFLQLKERGLIWNQKSDKFQIKQLNESHEMTIINQLFYYPEAVENAATQSAPHLLAYYLLDLAKEFHIYYNSYTFLVDSPELRDARLTLIAAVKQVIKNGLTLLGVSAPEYM